MPFFIEAIPNESYHSSWQNAHLRVNVLSALSPARCGRETGTGEQLGEPVLLGPEDEDDLGFSGEDDGQEEGYDDPYDSDYR